MYTSFENFLNEEPTEENFSLKSSFPEKFLSLCPIFLWFSLQ